mmetsp:Transcript_45357/g.91511  ORF Transcript_45357/g.91511 Transcript_45357/m.91511 type:complete len:209 (-) Transcript_45357:328-954(-)
MGAIFPKQRSRAVMVVGLDNAGKTTLLSGLKGIREKIERAARAQGLSVVTTLPTPGLQLIEYDTMDSERWRHEQTHWQIWDLSGQGKHRPLWQLYAGQVDGIVFVVDLSDGDRIAVAHRELHLLLGCERLRQRSRPMPLVFMLSKRSEADARRPTNGDSVLSEEEARKGLGVDAILADPESNVNVLRWHCGEDANEALEEFTRHYAPT